MKTNKKGRSSFMSRFILFILFVSIVIQGCMKDKSDPNVSTNVEELIGGVSADSPSLNAIGSLGTQYIYYDYSTGEEIVEYYPFCSGTLIDGRVVLTAKHCAYEAIYGPVYFGIGPDGMNPDEKIAVVDYDLAPGDIGGWTGWGSDIGVLFLAESVQGVRPLRLGNLREENIGQKYAAIGYGIQNNNYMGDTRRAGTVTLGGLEGRIYEMMFGSFDNFVEWYTGGGYYGKWAAEEPPIDPIDPPISEPVPVPILPPLPIVDFDAEVVIIDEDDGGIDMEDDASIGDGGIGDGGGVDPYLAYLQSLYDNTLLLEGYEAYVATLQGDSQPCYGDSGSPLVRPVNGRLTVFGVVSGGLSSSSLACDYGTIYATLGEDDTRQFLRQARDWEDPCGDVTSEGQCDGNVAVRCTGPNEGNRRITRTDCSLLLQTCGIAPDGSAACVDPNGSAVLTETGLVQPSAEGQPPEEVQRRIRNSFFGATR